MLLFLDESGHIGTATRAGMAIVILRVADNLIVRRVMRSARRRFRRHLSGDKEYRARDAPEFVTRHILERLATRDCEVIVLRIGRRALQRFGGDRNQLYAAAVEEAVGIAWKRHPGAKPVLHQRYEEEEIRNQITQRLLKRAQDLGLEFSPEDVQHRRGSVKEPGLEVVDAIAWAYTQWRRRNKRLAYLFELIGDKVVVDDVFESN